MVDELKVQNYLRKCELQYRADNNDGADCLDWLAPYCNSVSEIKEFLRMLGFKIKYEIDEEYIPGEPMRWVITTSGVIVYVNDGYSNGLFCKERTA